MDNGHFTKRETSEEVVEWNKYSMPNIVIVFIGSHFAPGHLSIMGFSLCYVTPAGLSKLGTHYPL